MRALLPPAGKLYTYTYTKKKTIHLCTLSNDNQNALLGGSKVLL